MKNTKKNLFAIGFALVSILLVVFFYTVFNFYNLNSLQNITTTLASLSMGNRLSNNQAAVPTGLPTRLTIPSIGVNAPIIQLGLAADGSVDVPKGPYEVAWFNKGPLPGEKGSSVIVGHYGRWQNGANSVFDNLNKLKKGDKIYVENDKGVSVAFVVREIRTYDPQDVVPDIFNKNDGAYLNLITCSGTWIPGKKTYNKRLVIFTNAVLP